MFVNYAVVLSAMSLFMVGLEAWLSSIWETSWVSGMITLP